MSDTPIFDENNEDKNTFPIVPTVEESAKAVGYVEGFADARKAYNHARALEAQAIAEDKTPRPKVVAATIGAGVGAAVGDIVVWIVEATASIDVPANVEIAVGVVLTAGLAFIGGYMRKDVNRGN